jgi:hypothetical protein
MSRSLPIIQMSTTLPAELKNFIVRHVLSVEQLEVLLLIGRCRDRSWTVTELSRELRGNEVSVAHWLRLLVAGQLVVETEDGFRFQSSPENTRAVESLDRSYRERPVPMIELIYSRPNPHLSADSQSLRIQNHP